MRKSIRIGARILLIAVGMLMLAGCLERAGWSPNSRYAANAEGRHLYIYDVKNKTAKPVFTEPRKNYRLGHVRFLDNDTLLLLRYEEPQLMARSEGQKRQKAPPPGPIDLAMLECESGAITNLVTFEAKSPLPQLWSGFTILSRRKRVIFVTSPEPDHMRLKRLDLSSRTVTDLGVTAMKPTLSPDGSLIAAMDIVDKEHGMLYLLKPDGSVLRKREVKAISPFCGLAWDPAGTHFYICPDERSVAQVSPEDLSQQVLFTSGKKNHKVVSLYPDTNGGGLFVGLRVEPDHAKLLRLDTKTRKYTEVASPLIKGDVGGVVAESPDARWLFLADRSIVSLPDFEPLKIARANVFNPPDIADSPLAGAFQGMEFRISKAEYKEGTLSLESGEGLVHDALIKVYVKGMDEGAIPEGMTYNTSTANDVGTMKTSVYASRIVRMENISKEEGDFLDDYELHMAFGREVKRGKLPGKLFLTSEKPPMEVSGNFVADIKGFRIIEGQADLTVDSPLTLYHITRKYLSKIHKGADIKLTTKLWNNSSRGEVFVGYTVKGEEERFIKLQCVKNDGVWKVLRTLDPSELFLAHPVSVSDPDDQFFRRHLAERAAARGLEVALRKESPGALVMGVYVSSFKEQDGHITLEMKYQISRDGKKPYKREKADRQFELKCGADKCLIESSL